MRRRELWRGIGILFFLFVMAIVVFYWAVNRSGAKAWEEAQANLRAAGYETDPKKMVPEMPAPEDNFMSLPILWALSDYVEVSDGKWEPRNPELVERFREMRVPALDERAIQVGSWRKLRRTDLEGVAEALPGEGDTLMKLDRWFSQFDVELEEIDQAAFRPETAVKFELTENDSELISIQYHEVSDLMAFQKFQVVRVAHLSQQGEIGTMMDALRTMVRVSKSMESNPTLISLFVQLALLEQVHTAVWEALESNRLGVDDLRWLQDEFAGVSRQLLDRSELAVNFELNAYLCGFLEAYKKRGDGELINFMGDDSWMGQVIPWLPDGVLDFQKVQSSEWMLQGVLFPLRQRSMPSFFPWDRTSTNLGNYFAKEGVSHFDGSLARIFERSIGSDFVFLACAIELYFREHQQYPETLDLLVPEFIDSIPVDPFSPTKAPLQYRRAGDRYLLYSVGRDQHDDGGGRVYRDKKREILDRMAGDLVWSYELSP